MGASSPRPAGSLAMTLDKPLFLFQHGPDLKPAHPLAQHPQDSGGAAASLLGG